MSEAITTTNTTALATSDTSDAGRSFELLQRRAKVYNQSDIVPEQYRGPNGFANCVVAVQMAERIGIDAMSVMQNLHVIKGKPSWGSVFLIACINQCGRFSPLRYELIKTGKPVTINGKTADQENVVCVAKAKDLDSGDVLESPPVSLQLAHDEGWFAKNGSKWKNMPSLMLRYRAATLFARLYAPEITLGMRTTDEVEDISTKVEVRSVNPFTDGEE